MPKKVVVQISELGPEETKELKGMLKEAVVAHFQISQSKEKLKEIAEVANEALGVTKAEFNRHSKLAYEAHKVKEMLDKAELTYENAIKLGYIQPEED